MLGLTAAVVIARLSDPDPMRQAHPRRLSDPTSSSPEENAELHPRTHDLQLSYDMLHSVAKLSPAFLQFCAIGKEITQWVPKGTRLAPFRHGSRPLGITQSQLRCDLAPISGINIPTVEQDCLFAFYVVGFAKKFASVLHPQSRKHGEPVRPLLPDTGCID